MSALIAKPQQATKRERYANHDLLQTYQRRSPVVRLPYGFYNTCEGVLQDVELPMLQAQKCAQLESVLTRHVQQTFPA